MMVNMEFEINEYITLKLEGKKTRIYVGGAEFHYCKHLFLQIPSEHVEVTPEVTSIDDIEDLFNISIQDGHISAGEVSKSITLDFSPEEEFWGHCSVLQAWYENNYDSHLLNRKFVFALLKRLVDLGDDLAKEKYKEEIRSRVEEENIKVLAYLAKEDYLDQFTKKEIKTFSKSLASIKAKFVLWGIQKKAPFQFFDRFDDMMENVKLAKFAVENNAPREFYWEINKFKENPELVKWGVLNEAPIQFYRSFDKVKENPELAKWGVLNGAPYDFFWAFDKLLKDVELTKLAVKNNALEQFYDKFDKLLDCRDLTKIAVENNAPIVFYEEFNKLKRYPELIKWTLIHSAPKSFYRFFDLIEENYEVNKEIMQDKYGFIEKLKEDLEFLKINEDNFFSESLKQKDGSHFSRLSDRSFNKLKKKISLAKWAMDNNVPDVFFSSFPKLQQYIELAKLGSQFNFYWEYHDRSVDFIKNAKIAISGVQANAPWTFYKNFISIIQEPEFTKWGVQHNAPWAFYHDFDKLLEDPELAKLGVQLNAPSDFYLNFDQLLEDSDLVRWALQYNAPWAFYNNFSNLKHHAEVMRSAIEKKALGSFYISFEYLEEYPDQEKLDYIKEISPRSFIKLFWTIIESTREAIDKSEYILSYELEQQIPMVVEKVSQLSPDEISLFQIILERTAVRLAQTQSYDMDYKMSDYEHCLLLVLAGKKMIKAFLRNSDELWEWMNFLIQDNYENDKLSNLANNLLTAKFGARWREQARSIFSKDFLDITDEALKILNLNLNEYTHRYLHWEELFQWSPIEKLMKDSGAERVSEGAVETLIFYLEKLTVTIIRNTLKISKNIDEESIDLAIKQYQEDGETLLETTKEECESEIEKGNQLFLEGKVSEAIKEYNKVLDPSSSQGALGEICLRSNRLDEAIEYFKAAISLNQKNEVAWNNIAIAYDRKGATQKSLKAYEKALEINPDYSPALTNLAGHYGNIGEYKKARVLLEKSVKQDPDNTTTWQLLGNSQIGMGDGSSAIKSYQKAVKLDPSNIIAWENMGVVHLKMEEFEKGVEAFKAALRIDPKYLRALIGLHKCYKELGDLMNTMQTHAFIMELQGKSSGIGSIKLRFKDED